MSSPLTPLTALGALPSLSPETQQSMSDAASSAASTVASVVTGGVSGLFTVKNIMVLIGILLIAAGVFSFEKTKDVILTTAKGAAAAV